MESMLYQGHRFIGGIKHFWMAVSVWKTNLVLEEMHVKNGLKFDQSEGSREVCRRLTVRMISNIVRSLND